MNRFLKALNTKQSPLISVLTILVTAAVVVMIVLSLAGCAPSAATIQTAIAKTEAARPTMTFTPVPPTATKTITLTITPTITKTQTAAPTQTPVTIVKIVVQTPTLDTTKWGCAPITKMNYSSLSKMMILLQAYVSEQSGVRAVSYAIPENLYNNVNSQAIYISYVDDTDGKVYAKRFIVYMDEDPKRKLEWKNGVFSIDGQCWIDPLH